jgi:hypothetical protein
MECLVSDIAARDGEIADLFYSVSVALFTVQSVLEGVVTGWAYCGQ